MKKEDRNLERYKVHAEFCKTFAHPLRLLMLQSLRHGEKTVSQIVSEVGIRQSTVSQQLSFLRKLGVVWSRREGHVVFYRLTDQRILKAYDLVDDVIRDARSVQAKILS
jgi:ArsR family transcriptional regulator